MADPIREKLGELSADTDADFTASLVAQFLAEAPQMLKDIGRALTAADTQQAARLAHSLAPNCGSFGLAHLSTALKQFELFCKNGQFEAARTGWPEILRSYSTSEAELQRISRELFHQTS